MHIQTKSANPGIGEIYNARRREGLCMFSAWKKACALAGGLIPILAGTALAAGGEKADLIVIVADTRGLEGLMAWWGNLYNESHLWFTLLTVVTIPVMGLMFGILADIVMKGIGIDLSSRELAEH